MSSDPGARPVAFVAGAGHAIALTRRDPAKLYATAAAMPADRRLVVAADIRDPASVDAPFAARAARFGRLDLPTDNAGVTMPPAAIDMLDHAGRDRPIATNPTGAFLCTHGAFRLMKAQCPCGGRIINDGSVAADSPRPRAAASTAAKHGLTLLAKARSPDGRAHDIACGRIDIGNAATDMATAQRAGVEQADGSIAVEPVIDVALVVQMAPLPLDANVQFMTFMATKMPLVGRG